MDEDVQLPGSVAGFAHWQASRTHSLSRRLHINTQAVNLNALDRSAQLSSPTGVKICYFHLLLICIRMNRIPLPLDPTKLKLLETLFEMLKPLEDIG